MWMRHRGKKDKKILPSMVGATGFEPVTPAVSRQCPSVCCTNTNNKSAEFFSCPIVFKLTFITALSPYCDKNFSLGLTVVGFTRSARSSL